MRAARLTLRGFASQVRSAITIASGRPQGDLEVGLTRLCRGSRGASWSAVGLASWRRSLMMPNSSRRAISAAPDSSFRRRSTRAHLAPRRGHHGCQRRRDCNRSKHCPAFLSFQTSKRYVFRRSCHRWRTRIDLPSKAARELASAVAEHRRP